MNKALRLAIVGILLWLSHPAIPRSSLPWRDVFVCEDDASVQQATVDLQRYLCQATGVLPSVQPWDGLESLPASGVIIGRLTQLSRYLPARAQDCDLGDQGYVIWTVTEPRTNCILLGANAPAGLVNAVYGLLRELGFEFYLGSEVVPARIAEKLPQDVLVTKPVLQVRGVLPWYNFFNSPTAWDPIDHRSFVDQLIRSGANFITFHSYDHEPFAGVEDNGEMIYAAPLCNTGQSTWGTHAMPVRDFLCGTDKLYDTEYLGARTTLQGYSTSQQIREEKAVLREALRYAKSRGLQTSFGFSMAGDPTLPHDRDKFIRQLTSNVQYFGSLDYVFLWQRETKGVQGHPLQYDTHILPHPRDPNSKIANYGDYRRAAFKRIVDEARGISPFFKPGEEGKHSRAIEGARLEMFARLALRILSRYRNAPRIVISGWGGDKRLLSAEYYDGLDTLLPHEVVFSSLDHILPQKSVDAIYSELPDARVRWPIPWLELDGDQWHPQPFLQTYEPMMQHILNSGSQGFLGIHWRTRDVQDNFAYLVDAAWNPALTRDSFYETMARKYAEAGVAGRVKDIYLQLDDLGYRWVGGAGQNECAPFTWGHSAPEKVAKLADIQRRLDAILPMVETGRESLVWLSRRIQWVLDYQAAQAKGQKAKTLLQQAGQADGEQKKQIAKQACDLLEGDELARAMHSYAKRMTTRGEYGVLATINAKAGWDWEQMLTQSREILGETAERASSREWNPEPEVIVPRFYGSWQAGESLHIRAIVLGGNAATLYYRRLGERAWRQVSMQASKGWVRVASIASEDVVEPGLEYGIAIQGADRMTYGPKAISVMPSVSAASKPIARVDLPAEKLTVLDIAAKNGMTVVAWNDIVSADFYQVSIDGALVVETPVNFYPTPEKLQSGQLVTITAKRGSETVATIKTEVQ